MNQRQRTMLLISMLGAMEVPRLVAPTMHDRPQKEGRSQRTALQRERQAERKRRKASRGW